MLQYILLMLVFGGLSASDSFEERVVGGSNAASNRFLFMVSIRGPFRIHFCAGTIISEDYVLTAAHCVDGRSEDELTIQYGQQTITTDDVNEMGIEAITLHPDFDPIKYHNDIALIKVVGQIPLAGSLQPVTLNRVHSFPSSSAKVRILGWGFEEHGGDIQKRLKVATLDVYSNAECEAAHVYQILNTNICARSRVGSRGPCNGDDGGPILSNDNPLQVGIVSWGENPCATKPSPAVYTRVSKYICWINLITGLDL